MIAQRFRSIGWVAGCAAAALCCYLASQSVASERAALAKVDREIASTGSDIRRLNTEIAARGRMGQIERWNTEVLALQAPAPGQFVANEVQLASLAGGKGLELDPAIVASKGAVRTVAYQGDAPTAPASAAPTPVSADATAPVAPVQPPLLHTATFVRPKPVGLDTPDPTLVKASVVRQKPLALELDDDAPVAPAKPAPAKPVADRPAKVATAKASDAKPAAKKPAEDKPAVVAKAKVAPAKAAPLKATAVTASLLPSDLGKLIAAEKKGARPARASADR